MSEKQSSVPRLWTRDFTIITAGSVISMFGNAISGFAMSLMVLDISKSTLLYAIYLSMYTVPQLIAPVFFGAVLDRRSRRVTIYTLDFISSGLYMLMAAVLATGWFSFPVFASYCFVLGCIQSTYLVAYESFYPLLISEGNFQKAYSIASVLETSSALMIPVSAMLYRQIGLAPLLFINGICFFIAAVMETRIKQEEIYIETQKSTALDGAGSARQVIEDTKEGFRYLRCEKGLMAVALYFFVTATTFGISSVITLPYFKNTFNNGEYIYMLVWGCAVAGRAIGGFIHYKVAIPAKKRYSIALTVYVVIGLAEGLYLFFPVSGMMILCLLIGICGVTSYTIRISATQSYVPDEKKGRFNGAFNTLFTGGTLLGEVIGGFGSQKINDRLLIMVSMIFCAFAALIIIGGAKRHVEKIYNRVK